MMGTVWAVAGTVAIRMAIQFRQYGNFEVGYKRTKNLIIVGSKSESERVERLLQQAQVQKNLIGMVSPSSSADQRIYLSSLEQLGEVVQIYNIKEIIFVPKTLLLNTLYNG